MAMATLLSVSIGASAASCRPFLSPIQSYLHSRIGSLQPLHARRSFSSSKKLCESAMANQGEKPSVDASKDIADQIIPHILNLYGSRATPDDFLIYAPNATFEDPLMHANGVAQIKSAFYSLSKIFSESKIVEYSIEQNVISPGKEEILIDNKQHYKFLGKDIDMISLIKLYTEGGKVVRHEDWWDKKPISNRDTVKVPLAGRMMEMVRRGSMLATHAMMRFGKDPAA